MANSKKKSITNNKANEIVGVIFIALAILCALPVYFNIASSFGTVVSGLIFGLFGLAGYVFPVVIGFFGVLFIAARKKENDYRKVLLIVLLVFLVLSLLHLSVIDAVNLNDFSLYLSDSYTVGMNDCMGGGVIGSLLAYPVYLLVSMVGSYIVFIAAIAIVIVAFTNLSIKKVSKGIGGVVKNQYDNYIEFKEEVKQKKNREPLFVESLKDTTDADIAEYEENPFDIRIETGENRINVGRVYKHSSVKKRRKNDSANDLSIESVQFSDTFKDADEAFVQNSLDLYNEGRKASQTVRRIKEETINDSVNGTVIKDDTGNNASDGFVHAELSETRRKLDVNSTKRKITDTGDSSSNSTESGQEKYQFPPVSILRENSKSVSSAENSTDSLLLEKTLLNFGVTAKVESVSVGPVVTRYEVKPAAGIKVNSIVNLSDDIALAFAVAGVRIEAPIPGKSAVGIEVPNCRRSSVYLRDLIDTGEFRKMKGQTVFALGKDIAGKNIYADICKMPHLLIAGETNSGKSVCVNTLIASLLYNLSPDDIKMIMIDPKQVELSEYNNIPHLLVPVVTDLKKAPAALQWALNEMAVRYKKLSEHGSKEIKTYNEKAKKDGRETLPQLIIIIDEVAELMMANRKEVEDSICRIAQLGRAAGIHLVVATQRPSVNIITGVIKANIPSRIAFSVASNTDSRTILDQPGAEKLLGQGDMLFLPTGSPKPLRVQGCFVSEDELHELCEFLRAQSACHYDHTVIDTMNNVSKKHDADSAAAEDDEDDDTDVLLPQAVKLVIENDQASISMLQRRFRIGYARAARLIDEMEVRGYISGYEGSKARQVLISRQQYNDMFGTEQFPEDNDED